jgi:arsenite-transporting ATPase
MARSLPQCDTASGIAGCSCTIVDRRGSQRMVRILVHTGKGGVGKTTVAAATALRCAERGQRTIVLSTDAAHSLGDALDLRLAAEPLPVAPNLWAQEVNALHEMERNWGRVQQYLTELLSWQGFEGLTNEELTVMPGTEELFALLRIKGHAESGAYDTVIVDAAPTGETLKLLSLPDVMSWWMERLFPTVRRMAKMMRPVVRRVTSMPVAGDEVFASVDTMVSRLTAVRDLLTNPEITSVRVVVNLERMVIREAQRSLTYLSLFNYLVDGVIINRVLPIGGAGSLYDAMRETQAKYQRVINQSFGPLPRFTVPFFGEEIIGAPLLTRVADELYGDRDPAQFFYRGQPQRIEQAGNDIMLVLDLPFADDESIDLHQRGDELDIQVGWHKHHVMLPDMLARRTAISAQMRDGALHIRFTDGEHIQR